VGAGVRRLGQHRGEHGPGGGRGPDDVGGVEHVGGPVEGPEDLRRPGGVAGERVVQLAQQLPVVPEGVDLPLDDDEVARRQPEGRVAAGVREVQAGRGRRRRGSAGWPPPPPGAPPSRRRRPAPRSAPPVVRADPLHGLAVAPHQPLAPNPVPPP
jgi:hypothetical protein